MSGLDIFAWIVLIILATSAVAVFCIAGWLPGHISKTRGQTGPRHPQDAAAPDHDQQLRQSVLGATI
jgi:hypothetical protein